MKSEKFISIPLNEFNFPGDQPAQAVLDRIHQTITTRPYEDLIKDPQAMAQIQSMGADLMINTFACNFKLKDGTLNTDPDEANYLNDRIYERLSLRRITDNMNLVPFILVGTIWTQREYQGCLTNFKRRLGLREDNSDLHTFSSVAMSPFVTDNFADEMGAVFKQVTEEEVEVRCIFCGGSFTNAHISLQNCWERIYAKAVFHDFLMQGTDEIYLVYLPMFNVGSHRQQIILNAKLDSATMKLYTDARAKDPSAHFTLHTYEELLISDILSGNDIQVNLVKGLPLGYGQVSRLYALRHCLIFFRSSSDLNIATNVTLSEIRIIKNHSLSPRYLSLVYPDLMPFYLYGTETQQHVEHVLLKDQNVQLTAAQIKLDLTPKLTQAQLKKGLIAVLTNRHELSMQPCSDLHKPQFFKAGAISTVSVYNDPITYSTDPNVDLREFMGRVLAQQPITTGTLILGQEVYNDATNINQDIATALSIIIDEKANTREVLKGVRQASRDSDFWLSDNAKTILHRNVVGRLKAHIEYVPHFSAHHLRNTKTRTHSTGLAKRGHRSRPVVLVLLEDSYRASFLPSRRNTIDYTPT